MGLINLDIDGDGGYDYDNSYIDVPPCGIVGISGEDPNMILTKLTIRFICILILINLMETWPTWS